MQLKKILAAGAMGAMMALSTVGFATTLADFPAPFVEDGKPNTMIVVGATAATSDVVGAIDLGAGLASVGKATPAGEATTTVTGGKEEEVGINENLSSIFGTVDDSDVDGLLDTDIDFNDEAIDVKEEVNFTTDLKIVSTEQDDDFGDKIALITNDGAIKYRYIFDDTVKIADIGTGTDQDELKITFLGKDLTITNVTNGTPDTITLELATEYMLGVDESVETDGKTVTVNGIGSDAVSVTVKGTTEETAVIDKSETKKVNGVKIKVDSIFYVDEKADRAAILKIGDEVSKKFSDGDSLEPFGEPSKEADALWIWDFSTDGTKLEYIGIEYNQKSNDPDDDPAPVYIGESLKLPNDYFEIKLDKATVTDYQDYKISFDTKDLDDPDDDTHDVDDATVLIFEGEKDDAFKVGSEEVSAVYLYINASHVNLSGSAIWYVDSDGRTQWYANKALNTTIGNLFDFKYDDTTFSVDWAAGGTVTLDITDETEEKDDIVLNVNTTTAQHFGVKAEDADTDDIKYGTDISNKDKNYRTEYGIVIDEPENNMDRDEVLLEIPGDVVKVNVILSGTGTTTTETEGDTIQVAKHFDNPIAKLDTEVNSEDKAGNLILIGGPSVNTLVKELLSAEWNTTDTYTAWLDHFSSGEAMIKLVEDAFGDGSLALIVAGTDAADTVEACHVLQNYDDYATEFADKKEVKVTTEADTVNVV